MNTKYVKHIKVYISCNGQLFIWQSLNWSNLQFWNFRRYMPLFDTLDGPNRRSHEYKFCQAHQDLHLIYKPFFHLTKCYESVVQNPLVSCIVSWSLGEIQDFVDIVYKNFSKKWRSKPFLLYIVKLDRQNRHKWKLAAGCCSGQEKEEGVFITVLPLVVVLSNR
jgi:hypothetical protein